MLSHTFFDESLMDYAIRNDVYNITPQNTSISISGAYCAPITNFNNSYASYIGLSGVIDLYWESTIASFA